MHKRKSPDGLKGPREKHRSEKRGHVRCTPGKVVLPASQTTFLAQHSQASRLQTNSLFAHPGKKAKCSPIS